MIPPLTVGHIWLLNMVEDGLDHDGCEPSIEELSAATGIAPEVVERRVAELREFGCLAKSARVAA